MIAADLNLAVPRRLGELGQSSHEHGGRHGIGRAKTKRTLANSRAYFSKKILNPLASPSMQSKSYLKTNRAEKNLN